MTTNEKNTKAIIEAGEIEKYSREYFVLQGKKGGEIGKSWWKTLTDKEKKAHSKKIKKALSNK